MVNRAIIENLIKLKCMIDTHTPQRMLVFDSHSAYDMVISLDAAIEALSTDRNGHWIYHENDMCCVRWDKWECSECHERVENKSDFCPSCGADMREEDDYDYERAIDNLEYNTIYEPTFNLEDGSM